MVLRTRGNVEPLTIEEIYVDEHTDIITFEPTSIIIPVDSQVSFKVCVNADTVVDFTERIMGKVACGNIRLGEISVSAESPEIEISDLTWVSPDNGIGVTRNGEVTNRGQVNLVIHGYDEALFPDERFFPGAGFDFPVLVAPGRSHSFTVTHVADGDPGDQYCLDVAFRTNSFGEDSVSKWCATVTSSVNEDGSKRSVQTYPQPLSLSTHTELRIDTDAPLTGLVVTDLVGRVIYSELNDVAALRSPLSAFSIPSSAFRTPGLYHVSLELLGETVRYSVIVTE